MSYIDAMAEASNLFDAEWSLTPIVYVNAPTPTIPSTGQYAGHYIRVYGGSTTVESELSTEKRKLDQGIVYIDVHCPDGGAYITSGQLVAEAAKIIDARYYGGVQFGTAAINRNAGYWADGSHVSRIEVDYICDYAY